MRLCYVEILYMFMDVLYYISMICSNIAYLPYIDKIALVNYYIRKITRAISNDNNNVIKESKSNNKRI